MKTKNKTTKAIRAMGAGLLAVAMGTMLALTGCSTGGSSSNAASTSTWPSAAPPPTSQTNTYVGTQSPGLYTVTIDHTNNTYSYQNLSTKTAAVSGTFTTTANGFLALSAGGYALEQLSRAVVLVPAAKLNQIGQVPLAGNAVFAIAAPSCQVIPAKAEFEYIEMANPYVGIPDVVTGSSGLLYGSTDSNGTNWTFGGELQNVTASGTGSSPLPDPFTTTCAASSAGPAVIQTTLTTPTSVPANFAVGPTGFFMEDRYQSGSNMIIYGPSFIGAVMPASPVNLSALNGANFLGVSVTGGVGTANGAGAGSNPVVNPPQLVSVSAASDSTGSLQLTGGLFPASDPTQAPGTGVAFNLGAQATNNGYFPSATTTLTGANFGNEAGTNSSYALVSDAGGKYTIFVFSGAGAGFATGWIFFQQ